MFKRIIFQQSSMHPPPQGSPFRNALERRTFGARTGTGHALAT